VSQGSLFGRGRSPKLGSPSAYSGRGHRRRGHRAEGWIGCGFGLIPAQRQLSILLFEHLGVPKQDLPTRLAVITRFLVSSRSCLGPVQVCTKRRVVLSLGIRRWLIIRQMRFGPDFGRKPDSGQELGCGRHAMGIEVLDTSYSGRRRARSLGRRIRLWRA
jgi:hypothetical protein